MYGLADLLAQVLDEERVGRALGQDKGLAAEGQLLADQLGAVAALHQVQGRGAVGTPGAEGEGVDLGGMGQWARYEVDLAAA